MTCTQQNLYKLVAQYLILCIDEKVFPLQPSCGFSIDEENADGKWVQSYCLQVPVSIFHSAAPFPDQLHR